MRSSVSHRLPPLFPVKGGEGWGEDGPCRCGFAVVIGFSPLLDPFPTRSSRGKEQGGNFALSSAVKTTS
jgi:hypothetical protein